MNKTTFGFILALLSSALACQSYGTPDVSSKYSGSALLDECQQVLNFVRTPAIDSHQRDGNLTGASYCMGMINGMMALNAIYQAKPGASVLFCPPTSPVTNIHGARLVVDYLEQHPEQQEWDAGSLMYFAFAEAYPCNADRQLGR